MTKPHIFLKFYPLSKRSYWTITRNHCNDWHTLSMEERDNFTKAYEYINNLNNEYANQTSRPNQ